MSASELWVAAQRAMPNWARGRMNATVIMISQGAMALGGVIWGSTATIAGASSALLGAAMLFLTSLFLSRRLSIKVTENLENTCSGFLSGTVEPEEVRPMVLTTELLAAWMIRRKIMNNKDQENEIWRGPLIFTVPAYGFVMALYLDWLGQSNRAVSAKTHRWPTTGKAFACKVRNEAEESDEWTKRLARLRGFGAQKIIFVT
jgi:hypothetical protein